MPSKRELVLMYEGSQAEVARLSAEKERLMAALENLIGGIYGEDDYDMGIDPGPLREARAIIDEVRGRVVD